MMWNRFVRSALVAALAVCLLAGGLGLFWSARADTSEEAQASPAAAPSKPVVIRPYVVWSGPHSSVGQTSYTRITSGEGWRAHWQQHRAGEAPQVDFDQCMVLAIYLGSSHNCKGIRVVSIQEEKDKLTVRFAGEWYAGGQPGDAVTPYGLFLVPRSAKPLVLEENVQGLIAQTPTWKLRAQFDAPGVGESATGQEAVVMTQVDVSRKGIEARLKAIAASPDDNKPLRKQAREAATLLLHKDNEVTMQFLAPAAGQAKENEFKNQIQNIQMQSGLQMFKMDVMLDELRQLEQERLAEAVEWRASVLYAKARLCHGIALLYEHNAQLGEMRKEFPERDPAKDQGWRLTQSDSFKDRDAARSAKWAKEFLTLLAQENPNSAWEQVVKEEMPLVEKGLKWEPWPR